MAQSTPPVYSNAGTATFVPSIWSSALLTQFDPNLVWASRLVCNRDYDGDIRQQGNQVIINELNRPSVGSYNDTTGMVVEKLVTVAQNLNISQADYVAFYVTDIERQQAAAVLDEPATVQAIAGLAAKADTFVGGVIAASAKAFAAQPIDVTNTAAATAALKGGVLLEAIFDMMMTLDTNKVPGGRYVVVSPQVKRYLLRAPEIANAAAFGQDGATANGVVASLAGFTVLSTTAMPAGVDILAGHSAFTTFASQFTDFRLQPVEKFRSDQIDALHLYGSRVLSFPGGAQPASADAAVVNSEGLIKSAVKYV